MRPQDLDRLREVPAPGEAEAARRARRLAHAQPLPTGHRRLRHRALAPAAVVAGLALVLTPPGEALADWVRERVRDVVGTEQAASPRPSAAPAALPGGGRLLGASTQGFSVLGRGEPRRARFGAVDAATWSPRGRFVAVARGPELVAVTARGAPERRWTVVASAPVRHPAWSPSGFRVAYLADGVLRVVAGDGTGDRALAPAGPAAPAWRPGQAHLLAYADRAGRVVLLDADGGRVRWRTRPHTRPVRLAWSADARRLLVISAAKAYVLSGVSGAVLRHNTAPAGSRNTGVAFRPSGYDHVVVRRAGGESRVVLRQGLAGSSRGRDRLLLGVEGPVRALAWSPDGRTLAVDAPRAGGWLLLRVRGRVTSVRSLGTAGGRLEGWCCPP